MRRSDGSKRRKVVGLTGPTHQQWIRRGCRSIARGGRCRCCHVVSGSNRNRCCWHRGGTAKCLDRQQVRPTTDKRIQDSYPVTTRCKQPQGHGHEGRTWRIWFAVDVRSFEKDFVDGSVLLDVHKLCGLLTNLNS